MFFSSMLSSGRQSWKRRTTLGGSGRNRLLKILHIDPERNWGGGEAQVFGLVSYLAGQKHLIHLVAYPGGPLWIRCQQLVVAAHPIKIRNDLDLRYVPSLRRLIKQQRYDIVHLHTKRAHALSLWLPRYHGGPKYLATRRMDYPERRNVYTHYLYNRRVDGVVAISQAIQNSLIEAGVHAHRIRQIYSGVDADKFLHLPAKGRGSRNITVVGCLAVLERRKGHRFLLESAALLKSRGLTLQYRIGGSGSLRAPLEKMAHQLGLRDQVSFTDFVDPGQFLADIDILALPSLYEGFGVVSLEGMAAAKPVVVSKVGGLTEAVVDGVTGFLVPPQDPQALAEAIAKLVREPTLAAEMGLRGRERVRQRFSLTQMAQQNEAFYYDLLEGTP